MANTPKLFDTHCENPQKRNALEMQYLLRMTKDDFTFYENQKRCRTATCINVVKPVTTSDKEFKQKECITVMQTLQDCPSTFHTASDKSYLSTLYTHVSDSDTKLLNIHSRKFLKSSPGSQTMT